MGVVVNNVDADHGVYLDKNRSGDMWVNKFTDIVSLFGWVPKDAGSNPVKVLELIGMIRTGFADLGLEPEVKMLSDLNSQVEATTESLVADMVDWLNLVTEPGNLWGFIDGTLRLELDEWWELGGKKS